MKKLLADGQDFDPRQLRIGAEIAVMLAEDDQLVEALDVAGVGDAVHGRSSTEVRQPPQPGRSCCCRSIRPVPRTIVSGVSNFITVTSAAHRPEDRGDAAGARLVVVAELNGKCGLSKPASLVGAGASGRR